MRDSEGWPGPSAAGLGAAPAHGRSHGSQSRSPQNPFRGPGRGPAGRDRPAAGPARPGPPSDPEAESESAQSEWARIGGLVTLRCARAALGAGSADARALSRAAHPLRVRGARAGTRARRAHAAHKCQGD